MATTTLCLALFSPQGLTQSQSELQSTRTERQQITATHQRGQQLTRVEIDYGAPEWRPEFARILDRKGPLQLRLGRDGWTTLTTTAALHAKADPAGDLRIPPGIWVAGLVRRGDDDGEQRWFLMLSNALAVTLKGQHPARTRDVEADFLVPLHHSERDAQPHLQIDLRPGDGPVALGRELGLELDMSWHTHRLSAFLRVELPRPPATAPPFSRVSTDRGFEILHPGVDDGKPRAGRDHAVLYTLWQHDGKLLDSCHERADPQIGPLERFQKPWQEQLRRIGPGGRIRFETDRHVVVLDLLAVR